MENRFSLILDFKNSSFTNIKFVQNDIDTSVLEFLICNQGVPVDITDQIISIAFLKSDNNLVMQDENTGINILDATNGKFEVVLRSQTLSAVGQVKAEISFSDVSGKKLSTATFGFTVTASINNGEGFLSSNEISVIDAQIAIWEAEVDAKLAEADDKMTEEDAKMLEIESTYNADKVVWDSEINNKLAEADNKIAETEATRQLTITATNNANTATTNANNATTLANQAYNSTITIPKTPVATYSQIAIIYPTPLLGWEVVTLDTGNKYKYDGVSAWIENGNVNRGGILVGSVEPLDHSILFVNLNR